MRRLEGGVFDSDCTYISGAKFEGAAIDIAQVKVSAAPPARVALSAHPTPAGTRVTIFSNRAARRRGLSRTTSFTGVIPNPVAEALQC